MPEFSKHFRVVRYDRRGHGKSAAPKGPYSFERFGRDILAIIDTLEHHANLRLRPVSTR